MNKKIIFISALFALQTTCFGFGGIFNKETTKNITIIIDRRISGLVKNASGYIDYKNKKIMLSLETEGGAKIRPGWAYYLKFKTNLRSGPSFYSDKIISMESPSYVEISLSKFGVNSLRNKRVESTANLTIISGNI